MQRIGIYRKAPSKKKEYEPKPYEEMRYPGERVQVDVKYVPAKSLTNLKSNVYRQIMDLDFTNRLNWQGKTMFESKLEELGIKHKLIKPICLTNLHCIL